jgi:hypothetical protein
VEGAESIHFSAPPGGNSHKFSEADTSLYDVLFVMFLQLDAVFSSVCSTFSILF